VVVLVALAVAGVVVAGDDDDEPQEQDSADGVADEDRAATTATSSPTTTQLTQPTQPTTTTEPPWQTATGADGAFQLELPADWRAANVAGDMTGHGYDMFSDDPERAGLAETALAILPTPQTRLLAMDGDSLPTVEETDILLVESGPASVGQQAAYDLAKQYTDVPILQEGTVTTPAGPVGWFETSPDRTEMVARKYVVVHDGTGWVLTYWSGDMSGSSERADRIVGSFTPT
jgi:hypothetical protein